MKKQFIYSAILAAIFVFAGQLLSPVEVRFVEQLTGSAMLAGGVFGISSLVLVMVSFYVARLSRRVGRRYTLLVGAVMGIVFGLLYASVSTTLELLGVKFAWAFAMAATNPIIAAYVQTLLINEVHKGKYFGYLYAGQAIAGSAGALLGGYVFGEYGFEVVAYVLALAYGLSLLVIARLLFQEDVADQPTVSSDVNTPSLGKILRDLIRRPTLRFYVFSNISFSLNWGVKAFLWPLAIISIGGSDTITGAIFATMGFVAAILLPLAGVISDYVGPYRIILIEFIIFTITGSVLALTDNVTIFWVAAALYSIAEVLNGPAQATILTEELSEDIRHEAMALDTSMDQIIGFVAPVVAGVLVSWYSPAMALGAFTSVFVFGFVAAGYTALRYNLLQVKSESVI